LNEVKVFRTDNFEQVAVIAVGNLPHGIWPSGDGTRIYVGLQNADTLAAIATMSHNVTDPVPNGPGGVFLFECLSQFLQSAVTGLSPKQPYLLALARRPDGAGPLEPLASFTTNPAGSAIVNAVGPIRQIVLSDVNADRRYLVIASGTPDKMGSLAQVQTR
jgi:hypothetical protein